MFSGAITWFRSENDFFLSHPNHSLQGLQTLKFDLWPPILVHLSKIFDHRKMCVYVKFYADSEYRNINRFCSTVPLQNWKKLFFSCFFIISSHFHTYPINPRGVDQKIFFDFFGPIWSQISYNTKKNIEKPIGSVFWGPSQNPGRNPKISIWERFFFFRSENDFFFSHRQII